MSRPRLSRLRRRRLTRTARTALHLFAATLALPFFAAAALCLALRDHRRAP